MSERMKQILNREWIGGTRVINCIVHSGPLDQRPDSCENCRTDLKNQFNYALRVNDFLNQVVDDAKAEDGEQAGASEPEALKVATTWLECHVYKGSYGEIEKKSLATLLTSYADARVRETREVSAKPQLSKSGAVVGYDVSVLGVQLGYFGIETRLGHEVHRAAKQEE